MGVTPGDLAQQNQTHNRKMAINFPFVYFLFLFYFYFFVSGCGRGEPLRYVSASSVFCIFPCVCLSCADMNKTSAKSVETL
jgi:hypothetical protein